MKEQGNADQGRNARWEDITLWIWLGISIHMGYVWDFHLSSNKDGLDPIDSESLKLDLSNTSRMVHTLARITSSLS